jgi:hypothetical protein
LAPALPAPWLALAHRFRSGEAHRHGLGTADLQRDLGGAIMQSILRAVLTAGYASTIAASSDRDKVTNQVQAGADQVDPSTADTA